MKYHISTETEQNRTTEQPGLDNQNVKFQWKKYQISTSEISNFNSGNIKFQLKSIKYQLNMEFHLKFQLKQTRPDQTRPDHWLGGK